VVPNPFIAQNEITRGRGLQRIQFTRMPPQATVRIYTISGNLVRVLDHSDGSGTLEWDVRTRFDLFVASGNYYFHVTTPDGRTSLGRFAVIN
jgi:flagellar hook assembly protein FlgD